MLRRSFILGLMIFYILKRTHLLFISTILAPTFSRDWCVYMNKHKYRRPFLLIFFFFFFFLAVLASLILRSWNASSMNLRKHKEAWVFNIWEGNSYPLQYSSLENSKDCIVHRVAKSRTWLSSFHFYVPNSLLLLSHFSRVRLCATP